LCRFEWVSRVLQMCHVFLRANEASKSLPSFYDDPDATRRRAEAGPNNIGPRCAGASGGRAGPRRQARGSRLYFCFVFGELRNIVILV